MDPDIVALRAAFDAAEREARSLVQGLSEELGTWRAQPDAWSVAECLDHLATANRVYLSAMRPASERALQRARLRRGPAEPGFIGRLVVRSFEPPVKRYLKVRAPKKIRPRSGPPLGDAAEAFLASQEEIRAFISRYAGIDLAGVTFPNPFIRGFRFSLATGLHILAAHERRHLLQAARAKQAALETGAGG
ncbi:MAG TPA: DinB family protein [Longimicrobiales bacterium]